MKAINQLIDDDRWLLASRQVEDRVSSRTNSNLWTLTFAVDDRTDGPIGDRIYLYLEALP